MRLLLLILVLISCLTFLGCPPPSQVPSDYSQRPISPVSTTFTPPKNIILMIGDGMGISQITAGMYHNNNRLNLEQFPFIGLHKPYSSDNLITDSAAGATAFACGRKTYNGAIAVDSDTIPMPTILEEAERMGLATGLVTTSTIVHATPASFIAHNRLRKNYEEIASDFLKTEVDLLIGGGKKYFDRRVDEKDLLAIWQTMGYRVSDYFSQDIYEVDFTPDQNLVYLTSDSDPLTKDNGRDYLPDASGAAAKFLSKRSDMGFFLMIEGAQIDWGGHSNKSAYIISEMIDFDNAIGQVLDFARADGETLVIVTADHETGGYAINPGSTMDTIVPAFTSDYHTADLIPVFAYGPGAQLFSGVYENTDIYHRMRRAFRWAKI